MSNRPEPLDVVLADEPIFLDVLPGEEPRIGHPIFAWIMIIAVIGFVAFLQTLRPERGDRSDGESLALAVQEVQAKYLVAAAELLGDPGAMAAQSRSALNVGSVRQRLRYIVVVGEMAGPREAQQEIRALENALDDNKVELTPRQQTTLENLIKLYQEYARDRFQAPSVAEKDRRQLLEELGWFGELALTPRRSQNSSARTAILSSARKVLWVCISAMLILVLFGLAGLVGVIVLAAFWLTGRVEGRITCGSNHGGVYAETFALWLVLYLGLSLSGAILPLGDNHLLFSGIASIGSLCVLGWPVLRGVPFAVVRHDLGITWGSRPLLEVLLGFWNYVTTLPFMAIGLFITLLLMMLAGLAAGPSGDSFEPVTGPSHPILADVAKGRWWVILQVFLVASVCAPIVEEIMFRGVLYRQLREATHRWGRFLSFLSSTLLSSFVFASLHPQGPLAVPVLMSIALGLTLVREWRGSLVPGMVTHGVSNGLVLTLATLIFSK